MKLSEFWNRVEATKPPAYLMTMPLRVLRGKAKEIERWLKANNKQRPTLWDLHLARKARKGER